MHKLYGAGAIDDSGDDQQSNVIVIIFEKAFQVPGETTVDIVEVNDILLAV